MKIEKNEVYTAQEVQKLLKISRSTFLRWIKHEVIKPVKVGGRYRILGQDLLQLLERK